MKPAKLCTLGAVFVSTAVLFMAGYTQVAIGGGGKSGLQTRHAATHRPARGAKRKMSIKISPEFTRHKDGSGKVDPSR